MFKVDAWRGSHLHVVAFCQHAFWNMQMSSLQKTTIAPTSSWTIYRRHPWGSRHCAGFSLRPSLTSTVLLLVSPNLPDVQCLNNYLGTIVLTHSIRGQKSSSDCYWAWCLEKMFPTNRSSISFRDGEIPFHEDRAEIPLPNALIVSLSRARAETFAKTKPDRVLERTRKWGL